MGTMIRAQMQATQSGGSGAAVAVELTPMIASLRRRGDFEDFHVASFTESHQYFIQQYVYFALCVFFILQEKATRDNSYKAIYNTE